MTGWSMRTTFCICADMGALSPIFRLTPVGFGPRLFQHSGFFGVRKNAAGLDDRQNIPQWPKLVFLILSLVDDDALIEMHFQLVAGANLVDQAFLGLQWNQVAAVDAVAE